MVSSSSKKIVVVTDLDGTLLDENTYSADSSLSAIRALQSLGIPIIFCSSKTRREQEVIRSYLAVHDPFIVENGSAIIIPPNVLPKTLECQEEEDGTCIVILGLGANKVRKTLEQIITVTGIKFQGFSGMSKEDVSFITGLDPESAALAKTREYSETIVTRFSHSDLQLFTDVCKTHGLYCTAGGRFLNVTGDGANKGKAVQLLTRYYRSNFRDLVTVGIGDSPNDAPMLSVVDFPYLVQRPNGEWRDMEIPNLNRIPAIGPLGFAKVVDVIKDRRLDKD